MQRKPLEKRMPEKNSPLYIVLHLRFKLRVPPHQFLAQSRVAATTIASASGLIWKIWVFDEAKFEMGGMYLFVNRETAVAYLKHPVIQAVCRSPVVVSTESQLWDVDSSLSALTRGPLPGPCAQYSGLDAAMAGGR
jgi:Putative mono-oxygenase ydhR